MLSGQVNDQTRPAAGLRRNRPRRFGVYADARGTVTVFFAVWALIIFGLAAVGVDGGFWYLLRRQAQNAADMAAIAGVEALVANQGTFAAQNVGQQVASDNGFTDDVSNADVFINIPPSIGTYTSPTTSDAVEAIVYHKVPFVLTSLVRAFAGITGHTIGTRAVAALTTRPGNVCVLSLNNDLTFQGSSVTTGNNCILASDTTDPSSINMGNASTTNTTVNAYSLLAAGGCYRCSNSNVTLTQPYTVYQPPTPDPFAFLNNLDFTPLETTANAGTFNNSTNTYSSGYYKNGLHISGNSSSYTLSPGLYVLGGTGLTIDSGDQVNCSACTFVILDGGTVTINGSLVNFTADGNVPSLPSPYNDPTTYPQYNYPSLDGMLFYQQTPSKTTGNTQNDTINGNTGSIYSGGIYMPGGNLTYNGSQGSSISGYPNSDTICTEIVASQVTISGSGNTNIDNSACTGTAAKAPLPRIVRILE